MVINTGTLPEPPKRQGWERVLMRRALAAVAAACLVTAGITPTATATPDVIKTWDATLTPAQLPALAKAGVDTQELADPTTGTVEVHLTTKQATQARAAGITLTERKTTAPAGDHVFRPYSGTTGLAQELRDFARDHPTLAKVESIGKTVKGQDILAVKVTKNATSTADGARPGTLYLGAQHAREWITPEMTRRLMHHVVDTYGQDPTVTSLVDTTELWFLPVANPDGYDYTFSGAPGARNWRKNLRDNNGDGQTAVGDGVDLNRNFGYRWGWDDEGSSPDQASDLYRGPGPDSEPETKALSAFEARVKPKIAVNYHSAAQVLLYGVGWQTATPTPDDVLYKALAGDPAHPAIPGVRPQVTSDISTSNGDSAGYAHNVNKVLMIADEMASCQTASAADPTDEWEPQDCGSTFQFPDSEKLIQAEFVKNLPFALSVARSAPNPENPVSSVGLPAAPFTPNTFSTSYAETGAQTVSVTARKSLGGKLLHYRVGQGAEVTAAITPWTGGSVYGGANNLYYDEYRGQVKGAKPGDVVDLWYTGTAAGTTVTSAHTTYTVTDRADGDVLVVADEGSGVGNTAAYVDALAAAGHPNAAVWNVAAQGAPDALGVLGHFKAVVWAVGGHTAGAATTLEVRDYLNEGGKLIEAGSAAGVNEPLNATRVNVDDFGQYWLGVDSPTRLSPPTGLTGTGVLAGVTASFPNPPAASGFASISDTLPVAKFPQFASASAATYGGLVGPFEPFTGSGFAAVRHADNSYSRLTRTVDLTGVTAAQAPTVRFAFSYDTEPGFDSAVFEAHEVGTDAWTTLPDTSGTTTTSAPDDCASLLTEHPFLTHYLTVSGTSCAPTGTSGAWNRVTGSGGGWKQVSVDLSAYAGKKVEFAVGYISDFGSGGRGVFVDDAELVVGGTTVDKADFESTLGPWSSTVASGSGGTAEWKQSGAVLKLSAAISRKRSIVLGVGLESASTTQRAALVRQALKHLAV